MTTGTYTQTTTNARYVAAKIAADLKRLQRLAGVGRPSDSQISEYQMEAEILLRDRYLGTVTYGFRQGGEWIAALKYSVTSAGSVSDQDPGGIGLNKDITGASFYSFLTYSNKWDELTSEQKKQYKRNLPFQRGAGDKPRGNWANDNSYRSGDISVKRDRLIP